MRILKILGGIIFFIVLGTVALGVFGPKNLDVERSRIVNASPEVIWEQISDFNNMANWSPWHELDPDMTITNNTSFTSGKGASYSWSGNDKVGLGTQEFVEVIEMEKITSSLIIEGYDVVSHSTFHLSPADEGTKVTWDMKGGDSDFMGRIMNVLFKGSIEKSYDRGLSNLAVHCEK